MMYFFFVCFPSIPTLTSKLANILIRAKRLFVRFVLPDAFQGMVAWETSRRPNKRNTPQGLDQRSKTVSGFGDDLMVELSKSCPAILTHPHRTASVDSPISFDSSLESVTLSSGCLFRYVEGPYHRFEAARHWCGNGCFFVPIVSEKKIKFRKVLGNFLTVHSNF